MLALLGLVLAAWAAPVDLNTASAEELDALPGIGTARAHAIIEHRATHGPFTSLDELAAIPGIGPATVKILRQHVKLGQTADERPPEGPQGPTTLVVDINTATAAALAGLPGIDATKAAAIVRDRTDNGRFATCAELTRVPTIGAATVATIRELCVAR